jgi:diguanylate cyclase (GGDEF)-like protein
MNVLIADDSPSVRQLLSAIVSSCGFDVTIAENGVEACGILLDEEPPQIAIIDWYMPGMDGVDVCRRVRERVDGAYTYIIMLTSKANKEDIVNGLTSGADDYLTKPFDAKELRSRLRAGRRIVDLNAAMLEKQAELIRLNEHLKKLAARDGLTNLWNHRSFQEQLTNELARAERHMRPLSLILLDVDSFKQFNDTYGHQAGDDVLKSVAAILQASARQIDTVARYGGEEFAIILPDEDENTSCAAAERFRNAIGTWPWDERGVTASFGVATLDRGHENSAAMIADADRALYHSKRTGKNRVTHAATIPR